MPAPSSSTPVLTTSSIPLSDCQVIRRNGTLSPWDGARIATALTKAFLAVEGVEAVGSPRIHEVVTGLTRDITDALSRRADSSRALHIEDVQDQVELALMRGGHHKVARAYVLYRESRAAARRTTAVAPAPPVLNVRHADGSVLPLDQAAWRREIEAACRDLDGVSVDAVLLAARQNIYDGISLHDLTTAGVMATRAMIEGEPNYGFVSARLLLSALALEVLASVSGSTATAPLTLDDLASQYAAVSSRSTSVTASRRDCSTLNSSRSISSGSRPRCVLNAIASSSCSVFRPSTTATCCTATVFVSSCRKHFSCG